jgi:NCS1 family nucleobase:cation symporter-1
MTQVSKIQERFGFQELQVGDDIRQSPFYNDHIAPTKILERTWGTWNIAALWVGLSICVPTYTLGGVLTSYFGLSIVEALWVILIANVLLLVPLILNAFVGTKYGIPFPVVLRSSFGLVGSNVPALIRAIVACGWFGIQTLFGGLAIPLLFSEIIPGWEGLGGKGEVVGFFIFWTLNLWIVIKGSESIKILETISAPILLLVTFGLLIWAYPQAPISELIAKPPNRPEGAPLIGYFMSGLTAMVGFWATISLNIPDFSRYARSQKSQIIGQTIGLPLTMFIFSALGIILTAASSQLVGETISDPVTLIGKIDNPLWVIIAMLLIIIATLSTNTAANIVSPTNDIQNIAPKKINHTTAVILTGLIGILLMSWELMIKLGWVVSETRIENLYANWLLSYSSLLGPIAGIMVIDYFIIHKQKLNLIALYVDISSDSNSRWNINGFIAFLTPVILTMAAKLSGTMLWFYNYSWFTGSILGGLIFWLLARRK